METEFELDAVRARASNIQKVGDAVGYETGITREERDLVFESVVEHCDPSHEPLVSERHLGTDVEGSRALRREVGIPIGETTRKQLSEGGVLDTTPETDEHLER